MSKNAKLKKLLSEVFDETPKVDKHSVIEGVRNFGIVGKSLYNNNNVLVARDPIGIIPLYIGTETCSENKDIHHLDEPAKVERELPSDASPHIMRVMNVANPLRSLQQVADETGTTIKMLFRVAEHLRTWGKVRFIHPLVAYAFVLRYGRRIPGPMPGSLPDQGQEPPV